MRRREITFHLAPPIKDVQSAGSCKRFDLWQSCGSGSEATENKQLMLPCSVTVTRRPLEPFFMVRIHAGQPLFFQFARDYIGFSAANRYILLQVRSIRSILSCIVLLSGLFVVVPQCKAAICSDAPTREILIAPCTCCGCGGGSACCMDRSDASPQLATVFILPGNSLPAFALLPAGVLAQPTFHQDLPRIARAPLCAFSNGPPLFLRTRQLLI